MPMLAGSRATLMRNAEAHHGVVVYTAADASPTFEVLLRNWVCSLRRVKLQPLLWALDSHSRDYAVAQDIPTVYQPELSMSGAQDTPWRKLKGAKSDHASKDKLPGGAAYMVLVSMKPVTLQRILALGVSALLLDVDISLAANPLPYLQRHASVDVQVGHRLPRARLPTATCCYSLARISLACFLVARLPHVRAQAALNTPQPMVNTGVLMARHPGALALVDAWANRTAAKHSCTSWACGDQEQLTALLVECGWKAPTLQGDESRGSSEKPHRQVLSCFGGTSIVALPPSRFANGFEWNPKEGRRPSVRPADDARRQRVITFHPNFNGGAPGRLEKSSLRPRALPTKMRAAPSRSCGASTCVRLSTSELRQTERCRRQDCVLEAEHVQRAPHVVPLERVGSVVLRASDPAPLTQVTARSRSDPRPSTQAEVILCSNIRSKLLRYRRDELFRGFILLFGGVVVP